MNRERIKYAISIMEQAQNLNMTYWQGEEEEKSSTIEELHTCGNTACFAGYITLSPMFQVEGGEMSTNGGPVFEAGYGHEAIHSFFEMEEDYLPLVYFIIYGELSEWAVSDVSEDGIYELNVRLKEQISAMTGGTLWSQWRPEHLVNILNAILNGDFDWLLEEKND